VGARGELVRRAGGLGGKQGSLGVLAPSVSPKTSAMSSSAFTPYGERSSTAVMGLLAGWKGGRSTSVCSVTPSRMVTSYVSARAQAAEAARESRRSMLSGV